MKRGIENTNGRKRVLVMLNARKFLDVVVRYALEHGWTLTVMNDGLAPHGWTGDGALFSYSRSSQQMDFVRKFNQTRMPAVALSYANSKIRIPRVVVDFEEISRLGARHLMERSYAGYAFCSTERLSSGEICHGAYESELRESGVAVSVPWLVWGKLIPANKEYDWKFVKRAVGDFIAGLPKPCALFCQSDSCAINLLNVVLELGYRVPDEVGILGTNDNPIFCESQQITVSSVNPDFKALALEACKELDRAMNGEKIPCRVTYIPPMGVSTRGTTGILPVADPIISKALGFMREHISESFAISQMAETLGMSSSKLLRQFHDKAGSTPIAELRKLRVEKAKGLLRLTDFKLELIARQCGFPHAAHFANVFRRETGETPSHWRELWS